MYLCAIWSLPQRIAPCSYLSGLQCAALLAGSCAIASCQRGANFSAICSQPQAGPVIRNLPADEQETFEAWKDALSGLAALGMVSSVVSYEEAVGAVAALTR